MKPTPLSPMTYGKQCKVLLPNGKEYTRVTRYDSKRGLYVVIATRRYYGSELQIWEEKQHGKDDS